MEACLGPGARVGERHPKVPHEIVVLLKVLQEHSKVDAAKMYDRCSDLADAFVVSVARSGPLDQVVGSVTTLSCEEGALPVAAEVSTKGLGAAQTTSCVVQKPDRTEFCLTHHGTEPHRIIMCAACSTRQLYGALLEILNASSKSHRLLRDEMFPESHPKQLPWMYGSSAGSSSGSLVPTTAWSQQNPDRMHGTAAGRSSKQRRHRGLHLTCKMEFRKMRTSSNCPRR